LQAAQITATYIAPTQVVAMARAQSQAKYGDIEHIAGVIGFTAFVIFCVSLPVVVFLKLPTPKKIEEQLEPEEDEDETIVIIKRPGTNGDFQKQRYSIPCKPDQFTELCDKIIRGEKTFAINQWEGKDTSLTRDVIFRIRGWFEVNEFGIHTPDNQLVVNNDGEDFMYAWLDSHKLPDGYSFEEQGSVVEEVAGV
jgi:hypothetical protein